MRTLRLFVCLCVSVAAALPAFGLANRVFVSARSGNNANACDNINTPCQTFAGAVTQLNPGGEAIVLDSGGYGPVTITQSLTIEAPPGVTAFIHPASGDAITINAGASAIVVLRGLTLNGGSVNGIMAHVVGSLHIESCVISGFAQDGILVDALNVRLFIKDAIVRQNGLAGIAVYSGRTSIDHCRFEVNQGGGVFVEGGDVSVRDSVLAGNGNDGLYAVVTSSGNTILNVYQCISTNNGANGIIVRNTGSGFVIARVGNSSISENFGIGLNNAGSTGSGTSTLVSLGNNFVEGNIGGTISGTITTVLPH